jgi:hypothetical protein
MGFEDSMVERGLYGIEESNPMDDRVKDIRDSLSGIVDLTDDRLARIVRLRLVTDVGFPLYDLSYCYGQLKDGQYVRVILPVHQFSRRFLKRDLVAMCRSVGVYAKGLGLLDSANISVLR